MLSDYDVRTTIHLLGKVSLMEAPRNERRFALLEGLARLIDADSWLWFNASDANAASGDHPAQAIILRSGFTDEQFALMNRATEAADMNRLMNPFYKEFGETRGQLTRLRQQIDPDNFFERSELYPLWKAAGVSGMMVSARPTRNGQFSMLGLYRRFEGPLFNQRDSAIAHLLLSEIHSLYEVASPSNFNEGIAGLSHRLRQVLNCLLQGYSRKEISSMLGISIHTVGEYIKQVYLRFDVHSQTQLLRRFLIGDHGGSSRRQTPK